MSDPIALGQTKEYITKEDLKKPKEKQTVWIIGALRNVSVVPYSLRIGIVLRM